MTTGGTRSVTSGVVDADGRLTITDRSPTDEPFWGWDRLPMLEEWLKRGGW